MNRFYIVIAILAFGLVVLIANHDTGRSFGMDNDSFGQLITLLPFAAMLSVGILASRRSLGESLKQMLTWALIAMALTTGYLYRNELQQVGNRLVSGLMPGRAVVATNADGQPIVILHKSLGGHFETKATVNGTPVSMLVDTGATIVALSYEDAIAAGIDPESLTYSRTMLTANGRAQAAPVRLKSIDLGPIRRENIEATVTQQGMLDQSLLGMSFLSTLRSINIQSDELRLQD
ncbi:retropepsin-like aspartic protease family protein [Agrobacterium sp. ES01]|uniref:retropepsin-like aspartic protease family protein n=1 Tax=Agrobacterium sp. ES01 TaxID=3420714 RepID=UPI003D110845